MPHPQKLADFVEWCRKCITGDEKGQAQIFLERLFQAFDHAGVLDVGGNFEVRVRKAAEDGGGTSFADLVWKPVVLVEMKKRGEDLQKHYRQAFDYWVRLVPNRPRYVVLCNFDEFWVYDFETQMDTPKDKVTLVELPDRWGPLAFLFPENLKPTFENDRVAVTRIAADKLANCFRRLIRKDRTPQIDQPTAQRFILQILVAFFAEDIDLLPKYLVANLLEECHSPKDTWDLIGGLFDAMNHRRSAAGGRFKEVPYFNGGLFAEPARIELQDQELVLLRQAAKENWSKVQPEIFGTLFEHSLDPDTNERHAFGAHFTHPVDIMKIVGPTIVEPWREQIKAAKTLTDLNKLLNRLHHFRVLDPACGSGNFLYIAYRELKRIEAQIYARMEAEFKSEAKKAAEMRLSFLSAQNFYGIDILPFAVEIAKVTMMIARKLAIDELHITEPALPLDNLDQNFIAADALLTPEGLPRQWPKADVIIGNPPFLGAKWLKPNRGPDYVNAVRRTYSDVPGMADYCVYWLRKAHDHLPPCTTGDPLAGRAGLVGTQNIRNNQSRVGGLDYIVKTGTIVEAVDNQPWSGEANVHVSVTNWVKSQDPALLPKSRRLWFRMTPMLPRKRVAGMSAAKQYELGYCECDLINSALSNKAQVSAASLLQCNEIPKRVYQGVTPGHEGFVLTPDEKRDLEKDRASSAVIHPYLTGRELVTGDGTPERYIIDFQRRSIIEAQRFSSAFERIKTVVLPDRQAKAQAGKDAEGHVRPHHRGFLDRWWMLAWDRKDLFQGFSRLQNRFIACSRVTKRPVFVFLTTSVWPSDKIQAFLFDDDYSFGLLQSDVHWRWFLEKCSKLKSDFSYSIESVFETFPWPQQPTATQIGAVAEAGREVRRARAHALKEHERRLARALPHT